MAGRPRTFDRQEALEKAMRAFWWHGYEGVSIAQLSSALGINPPSLYAAFGSKRALFDEAVALYSAGLDAGLAHDMSAPTALAALERLFASSVAHFSAPESPPGCLVMSEPLLAERRAETRRQVRARLRRAVSTGELDGDDLEDVAAFVDTVLAGLAARARDGARREELERAAARALRAIPLRDRLRAT